VFAAIVEPPFIIPVIIIVPVSPLAIVSVVAQVGSTQLHIYGTVTGEKTEPKLPVTITSLGEDSNIIPSVKSYPLWLGNGTFILTV